MSSMIGCRSRLFAARLVILLAVAAAAGCSEPPSERDADADRGGDADADRDSDREPDADPDLIDGDRDSDDAADAGDADDADANSPIHGERWWLHDEIESIVYVSWEQDVWASAFVEYRIGDEPWQQTPAQDRGPGTQEQIVLGIPYATDFEFRVAATAAGVDYRGTIHGGVTGDVPETMVVPSLFVRDEPSEEPSGRYLFGSITVRMGRWAPDGGFWSFIVDRRGRLVWARLTPRQHCTMYVRVSTNGRDLLLDDNTYWFNFDEAESRIHRIKIDGTIVETYDTPGLHHPFTELPDGTIAWGATAPPYGETLEELSPDGERRRVWDSNAFLAPFPLTEEQKRFRTNALFWDEETGTYLFSTYIGFYVLQIRRGDGEVEGIFGGTLPGAWGIDPLEASFHWQHGVTFTPERTLLLSMHESATSLEGVVREYQVDEASTTLRQVWTWGDGNGVEPIFAGEAHRLANGNTLINYGTSPVVREVTHDGAIVWEIRWLVPRFIGRTIFIEDLYAFAP
jgi:hypothetical protein